MASAVDLRRLVVCCRCNGVFWRVGCCFLEAGCFSIVQGCYPTLVSVAHKLGFVSSTGSSKAYEVLKCWTWHWRKRGNHYGCFWTQSKRHFSVKSFGIWSQSLQYPRKYSSPCFLLCLHQVPLMCLLTHLFPLIAVCISNAAFVLPVLWKPECQGS